MSGQRIRWEESKLRGASMVQEATRGELRLSLYRVKLPSSKLGPEHVWIGRMATETDMPLHTVFGEYEERVRRSIVRAALSEERLYRRRCTDPFARLVDLLCDRNTLPMSWFVENHVDDVDPVTHAWRRSVFPLAMLRMGGHLGLLGMGGRLSVCHRANGVCDETARFHNGKRLLVCAYSTKAPDILRRNCAEPTTEMVVAFARQNGMIR